jgi:hypothetical protein
VSANPTFSLCHTTARLPDGWKKAAQAFFDKCDHPENVEYILSIDQGSEVPPSGTLPKFGEAAVVVNYGRKCTVDGWNTAANSSNGQFLMNVADDLFPCEHWDTELLRALPNEDSALYHEYAVEVSTGGDSDLMPFSMLTRALMNRLRKDFGYDGFFFPEYVSVYSDTEFTQLARHLGVVVNAKHLKFEHAHPIFGKAEMDDVYRHVNEQALYASGRALYNKRLAELKIVPGEDSAKPRFVIAIICMGESFSRDWVAAWTEIYGKLMLRDWIVFPVFGYCTNVYVARASVADSVRLACPIRPHLVMWIDDDNPITTEQFDALIQDLNEHPELDGVAGWAWVQADMQGTSWRPSCGKIDERGMGKAYTYRELMEEVDYLKPIDFTGFPLFLMRFEALEKAGQGAFAPVVNEKHPWGFSGEDVSFSINAGAKGCKFAVDRRVMVRHQKLLDAGPSDDQLKALMMEDAVLVKGA